MFHHPAFAHFLDDIDNPNLDIPHDKIKASSDFIIKSSAIYRYESERRAPQSPPSTLPPRYINLLLELLPKR
jgi:hypothetical protein